MLSNIKKKKKNYLTLLGVIRSLGKAGYHIQMIFISSRREEANILKASKYSSTIIVLDSPDDEILLSTLEEMATNKDNQTALFPTDDYSVSFIDRFQESLKVKYLFPHAIKKSITEMMDKRTQCQMAKQAGFNVVDGSVILLKEKPYPIPLSITFPCFIKPVLSSKGGKTGIGKCDCREDLEKALDKMRNRDQEGEAYIQEYLNIKQEYTIGGICCDQQVFIPAVIRKDIIAKHNKGVTLKGVLVSNNELLECFDAILKYLRLTRYIGMFDMEILKTDKGFYFGEMNFRCGGPSYAYTHAGVNLPQIAVEVINNEHMDEQENNITLGESFVNNKVIWEDYSENILKMYEIRRICRNTDYFLLCDSNDKEPEKYFDKLKRKYILKHKKKKLKKVLKVFICTL